jgi:pimeloyl-ACP methyl ester carboxylesterase
MIDANETFDGTWPFEPNFFEGNGFRQHYVDEGDGDPIVCLHGEPTWGNIYRELNPR